MQLSHKTKQFWSSAIKLLVVSLSFVVIFQAIQAVSSSQWQLIYENSQFSKLLWIGFVFSLLNWSLEALKWKTLLNGTKLITCSSAFSETLKAHAVSIITPNKIGEFGAKASFYPKPLRTKILQLTLTGQLYQLIATCGFGLFGLCFIYPQLSSQLRLSIGSSAGLMLMVVLMFYLFKFQNKWLVKLKVYVASLANLSNKTNAKVFLVSILRYMCFSHQFYVLLCLFQPDLSYIQIMPMIFSIYFISSFVPTFLILDASLKAGLGLVLLGDYISSECILVVSLLMWLFNFGIPAVIGNLLFLKPKHSATQPQEIL